VASTISNFALSDFSSSDEIDVRIDNPRLIGLYQADDVYQYSKQVMGYSPRRARNLSGYWADTFSRSDGGEKRLFTPYLGFPNTVSDAMIRASLSAGLVADLVLPGVRGVVAIAGATFTAIIGDMDIVMAINSAVKTNGEVMSHEYGHYLFCSTLNEDNPFAVDHVVWSIIAAGDDQSDPLRYTREAIADYFTG
jgi:hypothetical protein